MTHDMISVMCQVYTKRRSESGGEERGKKEKKGREKEGEEGRSIASSSDLLAF